MRLEDFQLSWKRDCESGKYTSHDREGYIYEEVDPDDIPYETFECSEKQADEILKAIMQSPTSFFDDYDEYDSIDTITIAFSDLSGSVRRCIEGSVENIDITALCQ